MAKGRKFLINEFDLIDLLEMGHLAYALIDGDVEKWEGYDQAIKNYLESWEEPADAGIDGIWAMAEEDLESAKELQEVKLDAGSIYILKSKEA